MPRIAFLFLALVLLAAPALAQDNDRDKLYLSLVDAARTDVREARWCKIRDLYYGTSFYAAHKGAVKKAAGEAARRLMSEKSSEAVAAFEQFMREHGGSASAHLYAIEMYNWNKEMMKRKKESVLPDLGKGIHYIRIMDEEESAKALVDCAARGGDGKSMETAYRVADHDEAEAMVQQFSGLGVDSTESMEAGGKNYEILTVKIPDGPVQKVWFVFQPPRYQ
jgi:hypothetical protein